MNQYNGIMSHLRHWRRDLDPTDDDVLQGNLTLTNGFPLSWIPIEICFFSRTSLSWRATLILSLARSLASRGWLILEKLSDSFCRILSLCLHWINKHVNHAWKIIHFCSLEKKKKKQEQTNKQTNEESCTHRRGSKENKKNESNSRCIFHLLLLSSYWRHYLIMKRKKLNTAHTRTNSRSPSQASEVATAFNKGRTLLVEGILSQEKKT